jgi:cyanophycin synthetase
MRLRKVLALRGPNIWANFPVLEAWVDLGELDEVYSHQIPGFNDRLMAWLPTMIEHRCGLGYRGGFFERLRTGTLQGHILEHVTLELQCLAGTPVGYGKARASREPGVYKVVIRYRQEELGRACLETAWRLLEAAREDAPFDVAAEIKALRELADRVCLGPGTRSIVAAAEDRRIPVRRMANDCSLVVFGHGCKQRRILTAETDRTGAIAAQIASDKQLTRSLLRASGIPAPEGRPVESAEDAWTAARQIGTPVVVKPRDANHGRGVLVNLTTREQVEAAYATALKEETGVLVERYIPGTEHRLLVVDGKFVAAYRGEPPFVTGDGVRSIAQLVEELNLDPRRGDDWDSPQNFIRLDDVPLLVLAAQGYAPESIPPSGTRVQVHRNADLCYDVTDQVHPEVAARAIEAAGVVGLDIAGVDLVALDVARPLEEQGGAIVEVNAGPGLATHLDPSEGRPRPVGEAVINALFPEGQDGRIPLAAITGTNGKTTTTRLIAHIAADSGRTTVGMTCTDGIYVGGRRIEVGDCSGPKSAKAILLNPAVEVAVLEAARGGILREGLGFDRCSVGVVTNIGAGDHLGIGGIDTLEQMAQVKRTVVDVVLPTGCAVLKADDPLVAPMAEHCKGGVIFFARDGHHPVLAAHREAGKRGVFVEAGWIILAEGPRHERLVRVADVPLTLGGRIGFEVENALAAAAAAWGLGLPVDQLRRGLRTFEGDSEHSPGRFNVFEADDATVILDFGHNPSALEALVEALDEFPHEYRSVVFAAVGDRSDESILQQARILGDSFDRVYLYEEEALQRGRAKGELVGLVRRGLAAGRRVRSVPQLSGLHNGSAPRLPDELTTTEMALAALQPGEMLVILYDALDASLRLVEECLAERRLATARCVSIPSLAADADEVGLFTTSAEPRR